MTTYNDASDRVAMHSGGLSLDQFHSYAAGLPLWSVPLPWPCSNEIYEHQMRGVVDRMHAEEIRTFAFGDLFLNDVRAYREQQLRGTGVEPIFPLWGTTADTPSLAKDMINAGLQATLACVDPKQLDPKFVGREFNAAFLDDLPMTVDHCGERGEFHTFCHAGPMFQRPLQVTVGDTVERDGFWFADLLQ